MTAAQSMAVKEGPNLSTSGFAFVHNIDVYYQLQGTTLFNQAGVDVLNEDGSAAAINRPKATQVFELWRDAIWKMARPRRHSPRRSTRRSSARARSRWAHALGELDPCALGCRNGERFDIALVPTFDGSDKRSVTTRGLDPEREEHGRPEPRRTHAPRLPVGAGCDRAGGAGLMSRAPAGVTASSPMSRRLHRSSNRSRTRDRPTQREVRRGVGAVTDLFKALETDQSTDIPGGFASAEHKINAILLARRRQRRPGSPARVAGNAPIRWPASPRSRLLMSPTTRDALPGPRHRGRPAACHLAVPVLAPSLIVVGVFLGVPHDQVRLVEFHGLRLPGSPDFVGATTTSRGQPGVPQLAAGDALLRPRPRPWW